MCDYMVFSLIFKACFQVSYQKQVRQMGNLLSVFELLLRSSVDVSEFNKVVINEKARWDKTNHALNVTAGKEKDVNVFDRNMFLCFKKTMLAGTIEYDHYFVTDKKKTLELTEIDGNHCISISEFCDDDNYVIEQEFKLNTEVKKRMLTILDMINYSLAFRNCEHVSRYIYCGAWTSHQMTHEGTIRRILDRHMSDEIKKMINTPPKDLIMNVQKGSMDIIYPNYEDHVKYNEHTSLILDEDMEARNIVFLGPTGCGKSNLVNQLYNKHVVVSKASASSVTRSIQYTQGHYRGLKVNIVDTIGMCDTKLTEIQVYELIKDSIRANIVFIDKIVVVCAGRIEGKHKEAVKQFKDWLDYKTNKQNFVFIYNKCDEGDQEYREENMMTMCDEFGVDINARQIVESPDGSRRSIKFVQALGLKRGYEFCKVENELEEFKRALFTKPKSRMTVPMDPVKYIASGKICTIL